MSAWWRGYARLMNATDSVGEDERELLRGNVFVASLW
jgi:hypothetical protein